MNKCQITRVLSKNNTTEKTNCFQPFRHWNSDMEYVYTKKGHLLLEIDGNTLTVKEGSFVIIASNILHTFIEASGESILYIARIPVEDFYMIKHSNSHDIIQLYKKCILITEPTPSFTNIFEEMISANYGAYNRMYILAKAMELTIHLLSKNVKITKEIKAKTIETSDITLEIQTFIEKSLDQPISLSMLANRLGYTETYCSKIIKQKTNMGFVEYVNQIRLREAESYLQRTDMHITQICHTVGFNSTASFNRNFKKYRGISPTEFRKNAR